MGWVSVERELWQMEQGEEVKIKQNATSLGVDVDEQRLYHRVKHRSLNLL